MSRPKLDGGEVQVETAGVRLNWPAFITLLAGLCSIAFFLARVDSKLDRVMTVDQYNEVRDAARRQTPPVDLPPIPRSADNREIKAVLANNRNQN